MFKLLFKSLILMIINILLLKGVDLELPLLIDDLLHHIIMFMVIVSFHLLSMMLDTMFVERISIFEHLLTISTFEYDLSLHLFLLFFYIGYLLIQLLTDLQTFLILMLHFIQFFLFVEIVLFLINDRLIDVTQPLLFLIIVLL